MIARNRIVFLSLFCAATLCGCFGPVKTPPIAHYALTNPGITEPQTKRSNGQVLMVAVPAASPGYENEDMIYVNTPHRLDHYSKNNWIAPPKEMLEPLLVKSLQNSGCFKAVVPSSYASTPDITLNSHLFILQQEFFPALNPKAPESSQLRMVVDVTLSNSVSNEPITHRSFECVIPAAPTAYGGVIAANLAAADIMRQISSFVCAVIP